MTKSVEHIGCSTDLEVFARFVPLSDRRLIDVGCGDGALARALAERGANVLGVEADPQRAEANRALPAMEGVTLTEGLAQSLPVGDGAVDAVIFSKSLHHIPRDDMAPALREARRVLDPEQGVLYVFEPVMTGSYSDLIRPFHDETEVRLWAIEALSETASRMFAEEREIHYEITVKFDDFGAFVDKFANLTYNHYSLEDLKSERVRAIFESGAAESGYHFDQPMRANLYSRGAVA